jgi:hypothetical protein
MRRWKYKWQAKEMVTAFQGLSRMRRVRELKQGERQGGGTKGGGW